jgi:hypothetical protein
LLGRHIGLICQRDRRRCDDLHVLKHDGISDRILVMNVRWKHIEQSQD